MSTAITSIHVIVAIILMVSVLLQSGKGSGLGAAFGGSSSSVFGSRGPATLISRVTTVAAVIFMVTSMTLSIFAQGGGPSRSVITEDAPPPVPEAPAEGRAISEEEIQLPAGSTLAQPEGAAAPAAGDPAAGAASSEATSSEAIAPPAESAPAAGDSSEAAPAGEAAPSDEAAPAAGDAASAGEAASGEPSAPASGEASSDAPEEQDSSSVTVGIPSAQ
ncbi:MAG: preprotein translocase subunit SecG [Deltaproteobacteria bacterium]|jgi:preprotein translocase subunit SecG|nr:preprotein translocase subunit SecG [Deltaproteobacteria bacterium]